MVGRSDFTTASEAIIAAEPLTSLDFGRCSGTIGTYMKRLAALVAFGTFACGGTDTGTGPAPLSTSGPDPRTGDPALVMDECKLDTGYIGDEHCILPPPADKGFQVHYGPTDYDSPEDGL
jgi:hypothetical protein